MTTMRIAVIGAGLSGLMAARGLRASGHTVTVFEKSGAAGGRCATRRTGEWRFDHGAQYFTQRDASMQASFEAWQQDGVIAPWRANIAACDAGTWRKVSEDLTRWVAVPDMRSLGAHLSSDLTVHYRTTVDRIERTGGQWELVFSSGAKSSEYDIVLVSAPAPQSAALLSPHAPSFGTSLAERRLRPCIAAMLVLAHRPAGSWDAAFVNDDDVLSWVARNTSKPGRGSVECWVLHATPDWSEQHLEVDAHELLPAMLQSFSATLGESVPVLHAVAHRWRYAIPDASINKTDDTDNARELALYDSALGLGACGDWCAGGRIEGALLSGVALAARVVG